MHFIPLDTIIVGPRQRTQMDRQKLLDLKLSIAELGLINPIYVEEQAGKYQLKAGERRLKAVHELSTEGQVIFIGLEPVPSGHIPAIVVNSMPELQSLKVEFEENARREDLTWQERTKALSQIYDLEKALNPNVQKQEVAAQVAQVTGQSANTVRQHLARAELIQRHMERPEVSGARSEGEAYRNATRFVQQRFESELAKRRMARASSATSLVECRYGDLFDIIPKLDEGQFDAIITDPPYGYGGQGYFPAKTAVKHHYDDDPEAAKKIYNFLITEGFRICKQKAHLMMFCKPEFFGWLCERASQMAWSPFKSPIIWDKGGGYAPWGTLGFKRGYEMIFWATKGGRGLRYTMDDIIRIPKVTEKDHAAEKPIELMSKFIDAMTLPDDYILDPCMGSGATLVAAKQLKRRALGVELDEGYYNLAVSNCSSNPTQTLEGALSTIEGHPADSREVSKVPAS